VSDMLAGIKKEIKNAHTGFLLRKDDYRNGFAS
jgi:hypothetical protein